MQVQKSKKTISEDKKEESGKELFVLSVNHNGKESFALSVNHNEVVKDEESKEGSAHAVWPSRIEWILDSGCGRHLTGNPDLLGENAVKADNLLFLPNGTKSSPPGKGTKVGQETRHVVVEDVEFVPSFKRNLLSYVSLEKKGVRLRYEGGKRYLISRLGSKISEVHSEGDVLVVCKELSGALANAAMVCSMNESQDHVSEVVHEDTLYNWHRRFGHQSYDAIEALTSKPGSGIKLTNRERPNCMTCAEGKQTKDSGENAPIDRVGEVIC